MTHKYSGRKPSKSRDFWLSHYEQWQHSGLRKVDYCRENALYAGTFYNWCHTFSSKTPTATDTLPAVNRLQLIPVTLEQRAEDNSGSVTLSCATFTLTLPVALRADQIHTWLGAVADLHA